MTGPKISTNGLNGLAASVSLVVAGAWSARVVSAGGGPLPPTFVDVTAARGLEIADAGPGYGAGAAIADFDDDGDLDIWLGTTADTPDQVWRNRGNGVFDNAAKELGLASVAASRTALWMDFSGDGRLDLVVAGDCFNQTPSCLEQQHLRFHRQRRDGTFEDVSAAFVFDDGIDETGAHRSGLVAGDLDGDGWLDVVVGAWRGSARFLRANGRGGFVDISGTTGVETASFHHWQPAIHDFDRDGRPDIYWAVDFTVNRLWRNLGDGTFEDRAPGTGVDNVMNDMGLTLGDVDGDGDFDIFVTEIHSADEGLHNVLYRNETEAGELAFTEIAVASGVGNAGFGWGATFLDVNHDRRLDLAVANGWFNGVGYDDRTRLFMNAGGTTPSFQDRAAEAGIDDAEWGVSMLAFDMDRDGDLDLLETRNFGRPPRLLENQLATGGADTAALTVQVRQPGANRDAVGAIVRLDVAGDVLVRRISAGTSHLGQEPPEAHFGLGNAAVVDRLEVRFPDGSRVIRRDVPAGGILTVERSPCVGTADLNGDGRIDFSDLVGVLATWGPCPEACPEDVDRNGQVDPADLMALVARWGPCTGS